MHRADREIPGLLWTPAGAARTRPLVLIGHGAGSTKRDPRVVSLARRLVRHHSFAAAAIDGPVHGDRRADRGVDGALMFLDFAQLWAADASMADEMLADWMATVDALSELEGVGEGPVGWWGLSMGTIIGVPLLAADSRIEVAVLGLMGTRAPSEEFRKRIVEDARHVSCPVLFLVQWDDELMRRDDVLALFDEIGSADKTLHAHPGGHVDVPVEEMDASERFLVTHLRGT